MAGCFCRFKDEFESLSRETQVGTTLDSVEEHVQEQTLDPLYIDKNYVKDVRHDMEAAKEIEIQQLKCLLEAAEKQKISMLDRVATLRKEMQELSATADALYKLRSGILNDQQ